MKEYEVRDPVYGFIKFNELEKEIIDHPVFQRLRRVKQLGLTEMVYPGAVHTRFEHSLGVMHLATKMYDVIVGDEENVRILQDRKMYEKTGLKRNRQLIRLAALLHDVGHPPFSHAAEDILPKNPDTKKPYKHEDYTVAIIEKYFKDVIENHPLNSNYKITAKEVSALIEGNPQELKENIFWRVIISSQLDADRGDYLLRDSLHIGVKYGLYDLERLLITFSIGIDPEENEIILGVKEGGWYVAESLIISRYQMFTQVYFHKVRRAYDYILKEAIKTSLGVLSSPQEIEKFVELDDYILWNIMKEKNTQWFNYLKNREHLREIFSTNDIPTPKDEKKLEDIMRILKENNIWFWEDTAEQSWYQFASKESGKGESMIVKKDKKALPLSLYSKIVKNMGEVKKIRVYVKFKDRKKAKELIKGGGIK